MEINRMMNRVVGVDIGGSHITVGLVDLDSHQLVPDSVVRRKVDSKGNAEDILMIWKSTIESMEGWRDHLYKISIAMPGPFDYQNGISWLKDQGKYQALYGLDIRARLAEVLEIEEGTIDFENDAACFLQGEVFAGAARGVDSAIGLTLGTGLGSSKYHGDFAEDAALWSSPFMEGTVEDYLSTRWFIQTYQKRTGDKIKEVKDLTKGSIDMELTQDIFKEFSINLSLFLKQFVQKEKPDHFRGQYFQSRNFFHVHAESRISSIRHLYSHSDHPIGRRGDVDWSGKQLEPTARIKFGQPLKGNRFNH